MRQAGSVNGGGPMQNALGHAPRGYYMGGAMPCRRLGLRLRPSRADAGESGAFMDGALLGLDPEDETNRRSGRPICGECNRARKFDALLER